MNPKNLVNTSITHPRLVIAGMSGDAGKTLLCIGLLLAFRQRGLPVRAYKKGPDYIDSAWLSWAAGRPAYNLDTFLLGTNACISSFVRTAMVSGLNVIEGNRGLYDGMDALGTHSTALLAKILRAPLLLMINATKVTRTAAACVLGCQKLDPQLRIGGVILNRVNGPRHESVIRTAIEAECGIPVLGVLPRARDQAYLPARHLGLVTVHEHQRLAELESTLAELFRDRLDLEKLMALAKAVPALAISDAPAPQLPDGRGLRIGVLRDVVFNFYYPENLELLERSGATIVPISPLSASTLPGELDALYIGGGFPEAYGAELSARCDFLASLRNYAASGLPIYAECGGLMLLSQAIYYRNGRHPMAGVFPLEIEVFSAPQGHGYVELQIDRPNPFFRQGLTIRGHEFHYSRIITPFTAVPGACAVLRGTGCGQNRDGLIQGNVWASYTHIHALGTPDWAAGLLAAARKYAQRTREC